MVARPPRPAKWCLKLTLFELFTCFVVSFIKPQGETMRALKISLLVFILSISVSAQWTYQNSNTQAHLTTVFFIDEQMGWITSNDGNILKSSNGGQNWISYPVVPSDTLVDLYFFTADSGVAIGDNKIYKSYTGGTSWNEVAVYPEFDLINIYFYDNYLGFIACEPRRILKTTDSGNSWNEIIVDSTFSFNSLFFKNETIGWASVSEGFMSGGSIFKTTDAGVTWEKIHSNSHRLYAIKGFPESDTLFCIGIYVLHGAYRTLYSSQDGGETWTPVPLDIQTMLFHFSSPKVGRVCGYLWSSVSTNKILYTENGCNSWTTEDSTDEDFYTDWFFINDDLGWLVGFDGMIKHLNNTIYFPTGVPQKFLLSQNYPNPFNPSTKIKYSIPKVGTRDRVSVQLKVYDILGNEIVTLVNEEKPAGEYEVEFNAASLPGYISARGGFASGVYFYQFKVYPANGGAGDP
jgi:photosystem II stability/assembly factor-like uncharacterized protein